MATLTTAQYQLQWSGGVADRCVLYALKGVSTGDTAVLSEFSFVKQAIMLGATVAGSGTATVTSPNTVTMPAGLSQDAAYLLAWGASS
jgi:hypothetical protein